MNVALYNFTSTLAQGFGARMVELQNKQSKTEQEVEDLAFCEESFLECIKQLQQLKSANERHGNTNR